MLAANVPANFPIPFANSAGASYITTPVPTASQISVTPGRASLTDGFPPLNFLPVPAGGVPFWGADVNGLMYQITSNIQWYQAGGTPKYNAAFSTAIGGYPNGAILQNAAGTGIWLSTVDNNTSNPDTGGANWVAGFTSPLAVGAATLSTHAAQFGQVSGVVGQVRNLVMSVAAASTTATLTADEIIVETALGGLRYCLPSFNKTINLATTGAGGMDTGTATANGFLGIYAIYNPTTATAALLGTMEGAAKLPSVYGGANMPAGYTASALVAVVPISSTVGQFGAFNVLNRTVSVSTITVVAGSTSSTSSSYTSATMAIPYSACTIYRGSAITVSASGVGSMQMAQNAAGVGATSQILNVGTGQGGNAIPVASWPISTPRTLYYSVTSSSSSVTVTYNISVSGWEF